MSSISSEKEKDSVSHIEKHNVDAAPSSSRPVKTGDAALELLGNEGPREITEDEDRAVLRKIDFWLMPVILLVYFLQQLDKSDFIDTSLLLADLHTRSSLSYTSVFGIVQATSKLFPSTQSLYLTSIFQILLGSNVGYPIHIPFYYNSLP